VTAKVVRPYLILEPNACHRGKNITTSL